MALIQPGAFVRVLFPTHERPREPGLPHIGYVLVTARQAAIVAYTTSQVWPHDTPLPMGARLFNAEEAARLNQNRAFLLRLDLLARLPMIKAWFPDIDGPDQAAIAIAPPALQSELTRIAANVGRRRRELIEMRGP